ncbi:uncharacterized protein LOC132339453 [Haemorhous mexicanus]|uniref:uncharacterized protein LOC132339453 n=1 Tax=Haemorhous mexicanus TaxID=30427 RepID=UPI0028BDF7FA|nr:uncharacterized protein LOC132339453 [Haemorhous mexicanus]
MPGALRGRGVRRLCWALATSAAGAAASPPPAERSPREVLAGGIPRGGGAVAGERTRPAATYAGRGQLARAGAGEARAHWPAAASERRWERAGLSSADPGRHGEMAAAGGNPPRRAARPPPRSALPGLGSIQGCRRPRGRAGTDGSGEGDGKSGTDKGKAEPPLFPGTLSCGVLASSPCALGWGYLGAQLQGGGGREDRQMGEGKERKEGREGERKEEIKVERKEKEKGQGNMLPLSCCPSDSSPVAEPHSTASLPPESDVPPTWPLRCSPKTSPCTTTTQG